MIAIGFNGLPAYEILLKAIKAINGRPQTISLYAGACRPQIISDDHKSGWWNAENAVGEPRLGPEAGMLDFSDENSAFYAGGQAGLICGNFNFLTELPEETAPPALTPVERQANDTLPIEEELEITESPALDENKPADGETGSEIFTEVETDEPGDEDKDSEQTTAEAETGAPRDEEISSGDDEEIKVEIIDLGDINAESVIEAAGQNEEDGTNADGSDELSFKARLLAGLERSLNGLFRRPVIAQEAIISPVDSLADLGVFKSAQIYFSFAMSELSSSGEAEKPEPAAQSAPIIDEQEKSEEAPENGVSLNDEQTESSQEPEAGVEIIEWPDYAEDEPSESEILTEEGGAEAGEANLPAESDPGPTARNRDIFGPLWAFAQTEDFLSAGRLAIWYTLDKDAGEHALWHRLDVLRGYVATNALKGGYFNYDAPFLENWQNVADLQIKFEGLVGAETRFVAYLDSVWVEAVYEPVTEFDRLKKRQRWEEALKLVSARPDLRADEGGELRFRYEKNTRRLLERMGGLFGLVDRGFWQDVDIDIKIFDPRGRKIDYPLTVIFAQDGEFTVRLERPAPPFRPGRYTLKFLITDHSGNEPETLEINQDFSWGVLAINLNKSIYLPGDLAYLQMAVLDELGNTLCDADLSLEITAPEGGRAVLDTENGLVILNSACGRNNVIDTPDYYAYYTVGQIGEYDIRLTASTSNGIYSITDRFEVRDYVPFDIERIGPTRIYPPADYTMTVKITANEDFTGSIKEFVPESFKITNEYNANDANDMRITRITNDANDGTKMIIWENINLKQGEEAEITYSFKAPDRWPEFYLLGPLELEEAEPLRSEDRSGSASFAEIRYWQIAADEVLIATSTNGTHNGWTDPTYAWDNTNDTHASRPIASKTGTSPETGFYLESTANSAKDLGGTINSVEIGIEGWRQDTNVTAYLLPRFNGTTNGTVQPITNLPTGSDGDTTFYVNITTDDAAPATWTWADIINIDIRVYGGNANNGQTRTLYIDQIRIMVDYTPNTLPTGSFLSASQRFDNTGVVDIAIQADDADDDDLRAKLEYVAGGSCDFSSPLKATLDETDATATSTHGDVKIDNNQAYQIGSTTGWIITSSGVNNVYFDWQSKEDVSGYEGTYCLRLTVNDREDDQAAPATTTLMIDNKAPTAPGALTLAAKTKNSATLTFGATSTDLNFKEYKIYYSTSTPVTEADRVFDSGDDPNLDAADLNGAATATVTGLSEGETYYFTIWAYDDYGHKASSSSLSVTTNRAPLGVFKSTAARTDASGLVDLEIEVNDPNHENSRAKLEYAAGADCDFSAPGDPYLDENQANIQATYGVPKINNLNDYQIGNADGYITTPATNTVAFDWLTKQGLSDADGIYCLRLTVNDLTDDQNVPATTTVVLDNVAPTAPGALENGGVSTSTVVLNFGATTTESNFLYYRIFYKAGTAGVTESDTPHNDANLDDINYNFAASTPVTGLDPDTDYVFNIWAYDSYGHKASAIELTVRTNGTLKNDSLEFMNPAGANIAVADGLSAWNFRAVVSDENGYSAIETVKLRLADNTDNTSSFTDLEFTWTRATDSFAKTGGDALSAAALSASSSSQCAGNTCTLDFKVIFNDNFASSSIDYAAELYSTNNATSYAHDTYHDFYQVRIIRLEQIHSRWRNDDGGE